MDDLLEMTAHDGEGLDHAHVRRVMELAELIGVDVPHDSTTHPRATGWGKRTVYVTPREEDCTGSSGADGAISGVAG